MNDHAPLSISSLLRSTLLLTASALLIRTVALRFNLYLAEELGNAGMGLLELILSVRAFAVTFAGAGIGLAASRLTASELSLGSGAGARAVMKRCLLYALIMGGISGSVLLLFGDLIGTVWLGNTATVPALRLLALGLPCVAAASAMNGYFSAVRRVGKNALGQLIDLAVQIAVTALFLKRAGGDLERACIGAVWGITLSEAVGFLRTSLLYLADQRAHISKSGALPTSLTRSILSVTLPIALSSYIRSGLVTLEHILIPRGLRKFGASYEDSLAAYGLLSSTAMPILFFPASLLYALNSLLIPEIARSAAKKDEEGIHAVCTGLLRFTLFFGIGTAGILLCFSRRLGAQLSTDARVGEYLAMLAPLIPVMYLDSAVDSLLKGLGEQMYCMGVNIVDAALSAILVFFLVPRYGVGGYIGVIILSELINASFSISRLTLRTEIKPRLIGWVGVPMLSVIGATCAANVLVSTLFRTGGALALVGGIVIAVGLYLLFCFLLSGMPMPRRRMAEKKRKDGEEDYAAAA